MTTPAIECERLHPTLAVADVTATVDYYVNKLGFKLGFTWGGEPPTFGGVNLGDVQIFLSRGSADLAQIPKTCDVRFLVGDADSLYAFHKANAVEILEPIGDREYGIRDYAIRDLNGYALMFGHYIYNTGEKIKIERVDVPLRLEKRLAALLNDLAAHKRMSLTSCVEEILLHTNEPYGNGVASPHTKSTLAYIQELKTKHGIDYDSHASYRFSED